MSILLVEDNARLCASITRGFRELDLWVDAMRTGREALLAIRQLQCEVIILNLGLSDIDGLEVLVAARQTKRTVPVLVLSARAAVEQRILALEHGADDYLVKPFVFAELAARVRALLRRVQVAPAVALRIGDLTLDADAPWVQVGLRNVALSPREHALLQHMIRNADRVVSRSDILRNVFGYNFDPQTNVIDVHVAHLRRKLLASYVRIETIRGKGYRLESAASSSV